MERAAAMASLLESSTTTSPAALQYHNAGTAATCSLPLRQIYHGPGAHSSHPQAARSLSSLLSCLVLTLVLTLWHTLQEVDSQLEEAELRRMVQLLEEQAEVGSGEGELRIDYDGFAQVGLGRGCVTRVLGCAYGCMHLDSM